MKLRAGSWAQGVLVLGSAVWMFGLAACATQPPRTPWAAAGMPGDASLEDLVQLLDDRYRQILTLKALVRIKTQMEGVKAEFNAVLYFERPDRLRLQGLDMIGRPVFDLVARGEEIRVHLPQENRVLDNPQEPFPFLGNGGSSLKLGDLLEVLGASGGVYLDPGLVPALEKGDQAYILYLFFLENSKAVLYKKFWLERVHFRPVREDLFDAEGRPIMTILFDDYRKVGGEWHPFSVQARINSQNAFGLDYSEMLLNPGLDPKDFAPYDRLSGWANPGTARRSADGNRIDSRGWIH